MTNYKLFGALFLIIMWVGIILIAIGCVNFKNTSLCIELVTIGVGLLWIDGKLVDCL